MIYSVRITERAKKDLTQLPKSTAKDIYEELKALAGEKTPKKYVKKLKGNRKPSFYSLRIGNYRVILNIVDNIMIIHVIEVGHRKNIYRKY
ncbi:MAG: type II toxin-antitoxin system RelE/ParE family toxin [Methanomicrobiaceae archaeon]|nr:type II toxin-antitoxin system RelE/ParE family toxin [Methanomicrobiaceae archaeon]